jgi:hypothetical protein
LSVINTYASTEDKEELVKDEFCQNLEKAYDAAPSNDIKMVIDALNAKIGRDETYIGTVGNHSLHHNSNDNGQWLIDFAFSKDLVVSSTYFPHKNIHKCTWTSPDGITHNQIDHLLIQRKNSSSIIDVRTCHGASCGSDHHLVKAVYRCQIMVQRNKYQQKEPKIDVGQLNTPDN